MNFDVKQQQFAAYIRNPQTNPLPDDVQPERMAMYRALFFNNIDSFLSSNFPVLRQLLDDAQWNALAQDFYANHTCHTPYFSEIPEEFLSYLQNERHNPDDLPFLLELAHYEWVEMAVSIAKDQFIANTTTLHSPEQRLSLSPLAWSLVYAYPVHKISPNFQPSQPPAQPSFLLVYRDAQDDVHFLETTPLTYRVLEIIQEHDSIAAQTCLQQICAELPDAPDTLFNNGWHTLADLVMRHILRVQ